MNVRLADIQQLYRALDTLDERSGGYRRVADTSSADWTSHGAYLYFDEAEPRTAHARLRCVRIGTHARPDSLWSRNIDVPDQ
jgi:hypothetical protein